MRRSMLWLCSSCILSRYLSFISASQESSSSSSFSESTASVTQHRTRPRRQEPLLLLNAEAHHLHCVTHWTVCAGFGACTAPETWWGCKGGWRWWKEAEQQGDCGTPWWARIFEISIFGRCSLELPQTWSCAANTDRVKSRAAEGAGPARRGGGTSKTGRYTYLKMAMSRLSSNMLAKSR